MPEIAFPTSTEPGINLPENGGRLINAFAEPAQEGSRSKVIYRRVPGLPEALIVGSDDYRGSLTVGNILYVVNGDKVYSVIKPAADFVVTALSGTVPGTGTVFIARNMATTPNILILHDSGFSQIIGGAVNDFSDPDLPASNSLAFMDGYFFFSIAGGRCFASGINDLTVSSGDNTTAEANPDGLLRVVSSGRELLMLGGTSIEFYTNAGNATNFPFARGTVLPIGLFGPKAVAGHEDDFPGDLVFVGSDKKVYRLIGYTNTPISDPHLENLIEKISDKTDLEMHPYVVGGHACVVLQTSDWTMVYDQSTGTWHERQSYGRTNWSVHGSVYAFDQWLTFAKTGGQVYQIDKDYRKEGMSPLVWEIRSTQMHKFPSRYVVDRASFDFLVGVGLDRGAYPIELDPVVLISWSDDGGRTFSNDVIRRLGTQGEQVSIDIRRCGLTGRNGRQWRLRISDPIEVSFMGATMDIRDRLS